MKKRLTEWLKRRAYLKVTLICSESNSTHIEDYAGFLIGFDELGIEISKSHMRDIPVIFPWNNILKIEPWGEEK